MEIALPETGDRDRDSGRAPSTAVLHAARECRSLRHLSIGGGPSSLSACDSIRGLKELRRERLAIHDEDAGRPIGAVLAVAAEGAGVDAFRYRTQRSGH